MLKLLKGKSKIVGTFLSEIDANFIQLVGTMLNIAASDLKLKGYADAGNEPPEPEENDCWLVEADGTIWELAVEKDDIIVYSDDEWELLPFKLSELNEAIQAKFFNAENIEIEPVPGMTATNMQEAIEELYLLVQSIE